jgi:hypothetical protein
MIVANMFMDKTKFTSKCGLEDNIKHALITMLGWTLRRLENLISKQIKIKL